MWMYAQCTSRELDSVSIISFCKQKTSYEMRISDWSSDVCSSDLGSARARTARDRRARGRTSPRASRRGRSKAVPDPAPARRRHPGPRLDPRRRAVGGPEGEDRLAFEKIGRAHV